MLPPPAFLTLDIVSALLVLALAACFFQMGRGLDDPLPKLMAAGFVLLAIGMVTVSASTFDLQGTYDHLTGLRIVAQTGAALTLALAYVDATRHGRARPWLVAGGAVAGVAGLGVLCYLLLLPLPFPSTVERLADLRGIMILAHTLQLIAFSTCVILASRNFWRRPLLRHALVPGGFLAYTFSKYTWLLIDVTQDLSLVRIVYVWRLATILLLGAAIVLPYLKREVHRHGPA